MPQPPLDPQLEKEYISYVKLRDRQRRYREKNWHQIRMQARIKRRLAQIQ